MMIYLNNGDVEFRPMLAAKVGTKKFFSAMWHIMNRKIPRKIDDSTAFIEINGSLTRPLQGNYTS
jgi:hypothetical protein